jgi:uncharacterized protein (DUF924 family)
VTDDKRQEWYQINEFWFGELVGGYPKEDRNALWFGGDRRTDKLISERFGALVGSALQGGLEAWRAKPHGTLALVLLLDQFPRNICRGTAQAFAGDGRAVKIVREAIGAGRDLALAPVERLFFYMPLEHSERLSDHDLGIERMRAITAVAPHPIADSMLDYAERHRAIIAEFGRYPYRNKVLGRLTTPAEQVWLDSGAERFGQ